MVDEKQQRIVEVVKLTQKRCLLSPVSNVTCNHRSNALLKDLSYDVWWNYSSDTYFPFAIEVVLV